MTDMKNQEEFKENEEAVETAEAVDEKNIQAEDWSPRHNWEIIKGTLKDVLLAAVIAVILFKVIFNIVMVNGNSMHPTLENGNVLLINHLCYKPDYEDIVVFKNDARGVLIKRVIGLPGDTIEIKDSVVYRNGEALEEDYIVNEFFGDGEMDGPVTVQDDHVFVLGDNRPDSYDSRFNGVGQVSEDLILGGVIFRIFPFWG